MASVYLKPPEFTGEAVPVTVAAEVMGKDPQFIRIALIRGLLPIGMATSKVMKNDTKRIHW